MCRKEKESSETTDRTKVVPVPVAALRRGDSPRLVGEDEAYIRTLAEAGSALPPIVVHRPTMRVVDGMHRLQVARILEWDTVDVMFIDGSLEDAFVTAVRANTTHGLPLSLADREAAAARIATTHPRHSDRWISSIVGLSAKTVGAIRQRLGSGVAAATSRVGRDGRVRPLNCAGGRRAASEMLRERPDASLREVAKFAGISPATVRDVRERIKRGEDPVPPRQRDTADRTAVVAMPQPQPVPRPAPSPNDIRTTEELLRMVSRDPSLRFNETGRLILNWLYSYSRCISGRNKLLEAVPPHACYIVMELATKWSEEWAAFAEGLADRLSDPSAGRGRPGLRGVKWNQAG